MTVLAGFMTMALRSFRTGDVLNHFKGVLVSQLKASIASAIIKRQIPVLQIETELVTLSEAIQQEIAPHYARFGLEVQLFRIMSISMPQDDPGVLELKKAKAAAARRKIEGTNYQQERTFDVMQSAAGNQGMGGAFASMGMGLAAGQMVGQVAAQQVPGVMGAPPPPAGPPAFGAAPPSFQYFVMSNGQQVGPVGVEQLRNATMSGQMNGETPVWRQGLPGWGPARMVPELAGLFGPPPGMPPPFGTPPAGGPPPFGG